MEQSLYDSAIFKGEYLIPTAVFPTIKREDLIDFALLFGKMTSDMVGQYVGMIREQDDKHANSADRSVMFLSEYLPAETRNFETPGTVRNNVKVRVFPFFPCSRGGHQTVRLKHINEARYCMIANYYPYEDDNQGSTSVLAGIGRFNYTKSFITGRRSYLICVPRRTSNHFATSTIPRHKSMATCST